jgi:hypothetical protein
VFVGLLMIEPSAALSNFSSILLEVMMDETDRLDNYCLRADGQPYYPADASRRR